LGRGYNHSTVNFTNWSQQQIDASDLCQGWSRCMYCTLSGQSW